MTVLMQLIESNYFFKIKRRDDFEKLGLKKNL